MDRNSIIEEHYRANYNALIKRYSWALGSEARAEDVVQTAYTRALEYWKDFPDVTEFKKWFNTILQNAMRYNFNEENYHGMTGNMKEEDEPQQKPEVIPQLIKAEITALIERKKEPLRSILMLSLIEQEPFKEVSAQLSIPVASIRYAVHVFRKEIRDKYRWSI